ncbi:MAG: tRNA dihydrouridine synthase [Candidatus Weimeria sp.]
MTNLTIEAAPMEGITNYIYRNLHNKYFGGADCYFSPFIGIYSDNNVKKRDMRDVAPENNSGIKLVPQVLTNHVDNFIWIFRKLRGLGYEEVNLNLGCPSGTVTAKGRGAGFLLFPEKMNDFFDQVFDALGDDAKLISIKTRIGYSDPGEMERLSDIYNKYPFRQLIIHPRVREDFYNGTPNLDAFEKALYAAASPVIYNGNIFSSNDFNKINGRFSKKNLAGVMLGRGLIADPSLARQIKGGKPVDVDELKGFITELEAGYLSHFSSEHDSLVKIKEIWTYLAWHFEDSDSYMKKLLKAKTMAEYRVQRNLIFNNCRLDI